MQQVTDWLEKLGMSEYAARFAENDIDFSILTELTDQDLEKIGVASLGHRRKILRAIAALDGATQVAPGAVVPPNATPLPQYRPALVPATAQVAGERRYLTVMFCDLVGSTAISAQLDAEEWRDLVGSYLDAASAAVAEMGGHVAKKLGDGLMCLFGYPLAHENDAERAARAALSIQRALAELNRKNAGTAKPELAARIGLESGPAVLDASGEIYGDVANVAARVQAMAEPGAVLVTAGVQRQVAGLFVAEERGTQTLKGVPEPTALFRLVRASGGGRRSGQRNLTPLVGRDEEIAMLMRRWERARRGEGQLTLIVGEPGLGKSRLIEEFHSRLSDTPHTWVEWSCSQLLQNTPLHPIAEWGRQRFGGADLPAERRLADLENSLAQVKLDAAENAPLLAPLLDIPLPKEGVSPLAPEELRRRQLAALTNWVMAGAKAQPLVLAFEDLHWADPTTLDVLWSIAERGAQVPLYIVATTRPEFRPPWGMRSHHGTISLAPLDRAQVRDMVGELAARHALSREVIEDVAARTGGVPLFVEEVTRLLLERGEQGGTQAIPPTLQQSLMARLDRLGPAREVAQIGSVIGRGFSYKLLQAVASMDDAPLEAALEKLSDADIVLVDGVLPESEYRFKHALIQDAAYENLLKSRRQVLHRRIAETLRDRFADKAAAEPEVLAHHFTQAGLTDAAIEWWGKAGDQALRRSAFQEAIAHLGKAIEMADRADDGAPRAVAAQAAGSQRLRLQTAYGSALLHGRGMQSPETRRAFSRAQELAVGPDDPSERFSIQYALWAGHFVRGELAPLREIAELVLREVEGRPASPEAVVGFRLNGATEWFVGNFTAARAFLERARDIFDPQLHSDHASRFAQDIGVTIAAYHALVLWLLGEVDQARAVAEEGVERAIRTGHVSTIGYAHFHFAVFEMLRRCTSASASHIDAFVNVTRTHEMQMWTAYGKFLAPWSRRGVDGKDAVLAEMRNSIATCREQNIGNYIPFLTTALAEAEAQAGETEQALATIDGAIGDTERSGQRWFAAETHRIRGDILLKRDPVNTAPAEEAFLTAIAVAQQQKARSFELQAALSLAKLYQSTGRAADAHAVLAPALEGFSPTPEFPEIAEAQALLAMLADTDEAKKAAASRQRRLKLQTSYGQAMIWSKGFGSEETKTAFLRAQELAAGVDNVAERFTILYGLWVGYLSRGEFAVGRETAEAFRREAEAAARETVVAGRMLGLTCLWQGDFIRSQVNLVQTLQLYDPELDREAKFRFGMDSGACSTAYLAHTNWQFGEVGRARALIDEAVARAAETGHAPTAAQVYQFKALLEVFRGDANGTLHAAETVVGLGRDHGLAIALGWGTPCLRWAQARLGDRDTGVTELTKALATYADQYKLFVPLFQGLLAEIQARQDGEEALARIDKAVALAGQTGEHWTDALLHRIRGEILLKRDPVNTAPAEEAFLTAIAVAQQQKARSFELQAVLSLAKLYQSTGRPADAHAVVAPALEGFSPTPEFPEIEEAEALLEVLEQDEVVKAESARRERRVQLQLAYGAALMSARGYGAEDTVKAFDRARELSAGVGRSVDQLALLYGTWLGAVTTESFEAATKASAALLAEATQARNRGVIGVAHRAVGATLLYGGLFDEAKHQFDEATSLLASSDEAELAQRFNGGPRAAVHSLRAVAAWMTSDLDAAARDAQDAVAEAEGADDAMTKGYVYGWAVLLAAIRRDVPLTGFNSRRLLNVVADTGLRAWAPAAEQFERWSRSMSGGGPFSASELRAARPVLKEVGHDKLVTPVIGVLAAEAEVGNGHVDEALALLGELIAEVRASGLRWHEAELLRVSGEARLFGPSADPDRAARDLGAAIAVAREQGARAFGLRAALSLAKLYHSTRRPLQAQDVLAPALEGFSPTPEFPEIAEARTLLAALV